MKIKAIARICAKSKYIQIREQKPSHGEDPIQWIGDTGALYPIFDLPYMGKEEFCTILDIQEKDREKYAFFHEPVPPEINFADTDPAENVIDTKEFDFNIGMRGGEFLPLQTQQGITFINTAYLAPLKDVLDEVELYERISQDGQIYIAAKVGMLIKAIIMPYKVINEEFTRKIQKFAFQCAHALEYKKQ